MQLNKDFYSTIHRSLLGADIEYIHHKMSTADDETEVAKIMNHSVARKVLRKLMSGQPFNLSLMEVLLNLFKCRRLRINETHKELYEIPSRPKAPLDTSLFFPSLEEAAAHLNIELNCHVASVYILCKDANKFWCLVYINIKEHTISYINPAFGLTDFDERNVAVATETTQAIKDLLLNSFPNETYECKRFPYQFYQPNEDDFSSGLYVFMIIYYLEMKCPISFRRNDLDKMRYNIAYWILIEQLPY